MRHVILMFGLLLATGGVHAQQQAAQLPPAQQEPVQPASEWNPRTGDAWIDAVLADINLYGRRYPDAFADELARYHAAPRDDVVALLADPAWTPGDIYFACALAKSIGRACRYVADEWQAHAGEGWGAYAQQLGLKPGSPAFKALKDGIAEAYAHWGRPLPPPSAGKPGKRIRKPHARKQ